MAATAQERRKEPRLRLALPVRVEGFDPDGRTWEEMSTTREVSSGGASLTLHHEHGVGQVVLLYLPLPRSLRRYGLVGGSYRIYALIRRSRTLDATGREVAVMFLGERPPRDFQDNPGMRYAIEGDEAVASQQGGGAGQAERRRYERLQLFVNLKLRGTSGRGEEQTVTENVSLGGMRVLTTLRLRAGDLVVVSDVSGETSASAIVCNSYQGPDGVTRLNLQFPDGASLRQLLASAGAPPLPQPGGPETPAAGQGRRGDGPAH